MKISSLLLLIFLPVFLYAQWTKTNGPIGGKVRSFASDGTDMFVTLGGGGIHGSFDKYCPHFVTIKDKCNYRTYLSLNNS